MDFSNGRATDNSSPGFISFRDPSGQLIINGNRVFRVVGEAASDATKKVLAAPLTAELIAKKLLVATKQIDGDEVLPQLNGSMPQGAPIVLEHEQIGFVSYPYEWPPEMLNAAGELTLDLMERLLAETYGLKDATPYNVLFNGPKPIFVDFLSIEERDPLDPTWMPYAQFVRTFIRPLLANKYFALGLDQTFRVYRDGLQPEHVFRMLSFRQKLLPLFLTSVSLPVVLSRMKSARSDDLYRPRKARSVEEARFILQRQVRGLRRKLRAAVPDPGRASTWVDYETSDDREKSYLPFKSDFIEKTITNVRPKTVLDVGCNRGHFSLLAAKAGCSVVAIDQDAVVVGALWREASRSNRDILPLVVDLTRPTAGLGWRNMETRGFLDRALGSFDCVFMLAVIHHMLVTERIPLVEILKLASELTRDRLIIEWVDPEDQMFRMLTRGNQKLYESLTRELFEDTSAKYFSIERKESFEDGHRTLYEMRRRHPLV